MLGLLYKDIIYCKAMWKTILILALFMIVLGFFYNSMSTMTLLCIIIGGNFSMLPFSYDNYSDWNYYQYAFPVSKKEAVCSRYLFALLLFGLCILLQIAIMIVQNILFPPILDSMYWYWVITEMIPICFIALMQAISYPLLYHFGAEKGRIYIVITVGIVAAMVGATANVTDSLHHLFAFHEKQHYGFILICMLLALAIFYALSLMVSIKIECKKSM